MLRMIFNEEGRHYTFYQNIIRIRLRYNRYCQLYRII